MTLEGMQLGFKNASAVDVEVYLKLGDTGTAASGTGVTPVNVNTESAYTVTCTCEKGADFRQRWCGYFWWIRDWRLLFPLQDEKSSFHNFPMDIILAPNGSFSMWATDAGATYYVTIALWLYDR